MPFRCATGRTPHCVKLNNYGCLKHGPANPYAATPAPRGASSADDRSGCKRDHALFEHPKRSGAASFRWFELNFKERGLETAAQPANRYSPCDTHGSVALKKDSVTRGHWGRTCATAAWMSALVASSYPVALRALWPVL